MTRHFNPAHRRQALQWARDLMKRDFYVLDTETTGLGKEDEIVQIAIIDRDGNTLMDQLVKPSIPIPPGASQVHGIIDAHVFNAPNFRQLYIGLSKLLAGEMVVAYNMDFDWRLLQQTTARYRLPEIRIGKRDCAMKQYAKFKGKRHGNGRGYAWHKLGNALLQEGLPVSDAHDALGDSLMTLALLQKMAKST